MTEYEQMLSLAAGLDLKVYEMDLKSGAKGVIKGKKIAVLRGLSDVAKACVVCEEIGHDQTGIGNILSQDTVVKRKQELRAREWAYRCMIPLDRIIMAHRSRISSRHEFADYVGVTEEFLQDAIDRYTAKYGVFLKFDEHYTICFEPLGVLELFDFEGR